MTAEMSAHLTSDAETPREYPILVLEEDGDFYVTWRGERGEKNLLHGAWDENIISGRFELRPVPGTVRLNVDWASL